MLIVRIKGSNAPYDTRTSPHNTTPHNYSEFNETLGPSICVTNWCCPFIGQKVNLIDICCVAHRFQSNISFLMDIISVTDTWSGAIDGDASVHTVCKNVIFANATLRIIISCYLSPCTWLLGHLSDWLWNGQTSKSIGIRCNIISHIRNAYCSSQLKLHNHHLDIDWSLHNIHHFNSYFYFFVSSLMNEILFEWKSNWKWKWNTKTFQPQWLNGSLARMQNDF